jgi:hypothetical protein
VDGGFDGGHPTVHEMLDGYLLAPERTKGS